MSEATEIASMGITTMIELMQARDEIKRLKEQLVKQEQRSDSEHTGEPVSIVEKIIKNLEPLLSAKNQSWSQAEKMLIDILAAAKQKQGEPVAIHQYRFKELGKKGPWYDGKDKTSWHESTYEHRVLYTTPQQRKPLTDEQIEAQKPDWFQADLKPESIFHRGVRAAEATHGIKE